MPTVSNDNSGIVVIRGALSHSCDSYCKDLQERVVTERGGMCAEFVKINVLSMQNSSLTSVRICLYVDLMTIGHKT